MHAAKHFDPQMGIDIHLYVFPPVPTPIPLPTPHIGIVLDLFDYLPFIGATIQVNGVRRATAGTGGITAHIPLGPWMPTMKMPGGPQWEDELFMGSMTVIADGDPMSRIAMPVLDCNVVGMINPFRKGKPKKPQLSMSLPTSVNLAIPNNVNVGGPPMISIMGMLFKGAFAGLGRLAKTRAVKRLMVRGRNRWRKLFANMEPGFLKCTVLRAEPVDTRTGAVSVTHEDFSLPGRLPMSWTRRYRSDEIDHAGVCGWGWTTPADIALVISEDGVVFLPVEGPPAVYDRLPLPGEGLIDPIDGARLSRVRGARGDGRDDELHLRTKDDVIHVFAAPPANVVPMPGLPPRRLRIERLEDRCNNAWTFERDGEHLTRIVERGLDDSPGRYIDVASQGGRIHAMALHDPITGQSWPLVKYRHDAHGDLEAALDALDAARTFAYRDHRMVRHTDRVGLSFHYEFDDQARVVHSWGDGGLYDYHFAYHDELHETEVTDSLGHTTLIKFDGHGLPLCEIDPLGGCTFFEYDEWGRTTGVTDPQGLRTQFAYDEHGNLLTLTRPDGSTLEQAFNEDDRLIQVADPDGHAWRQRHDARGLLIEQTDPLGARAHYAYNARGQLTEHTNARGATTRLAYDRHGLLAALTDALDQRSMFAHQAPGRLIQQADPLGQSSSYHYDAKGRLLRLRSPGGGDVQCEYDAEDQLIRYVDEAGAQTRLQYVGIGQIGKRLQADGHTVEYRYDTEERLIAVINQRGEHYELKRDALGRIVEEIDYWGQARRYEYDAAGRLTAATDPLGQRIGYSTDKLGRITKKTFADVRQPGQQAQEHFVYDRRGQLIELRNAHRTATRRFDALGQLLEEVQDGFRVGYGYDEVGNRIGRETSAGNRIGFGYDLRDQVIEVAINDEAPIAIERDALGRATRERLSAQVERTFAYDGRSLLTAQAVLKDAAPLFETSYAYDRAGNLTQRRDSVQGVDEYRYDAIGRLLQHTDPKGKLTRFFNDPAGDRLRTTVKEVHARKVVGGENDTQGEWIREGTYEGVHYVFDRAGDLIRKGSPRGPEPGDLELTWDANHRLAQSRKDGQTTHYGYDALGRRVFKRNPTHTTWFYWDGDALLGEVKQAHDDPDAAPVWIGNVADLLEARRRTERLARLHDRTREYVYYPGTFVPLALVEKELREVGEDSAPIGVVTPPVKSEAAAPSTTQAKPRNAKPAASATPLGEKGGPIQLRDTSPAKLGMSDKAKSASLGNGLGQLDGRPLGGAPREEPTTESDKPDALAPQDKPTETAELAKVIGFGVQLGSGTSKVTPAKPNSKDQVAAASTLAAAVTSFPTNASSSTTPGWAKTVYHYQVDPNGCPVRLLDSVGNEIWSGRYAAWGERFEVHVENVESCLRFQGQYCDSETSFNYVLNRYYDVSTGDFISQDPIGLLGGSNVYTYAPNPLLWADPVGLSSTYRLSQNLAAAGRPVGIGQTAHHIVQQNNPSKYADLSRKLLARNGLDVEIAENGARLWGTASTQAAQAGHPGRRAARSAGNYHAGTHIHSPDNDKLLFKILRSAEARGGADSIKRVLNNLNQRYESGSWKKSFAACRG